MAIFTNHRTNGYDVIMICWRERCAGLRRSIGVDVLLSLRRVIHCNLVLRSARKLFPIRLLKHLQQCLCKCMPETTFCINRVFFNISHFALVKMQLVTTVVVGPTGKSGSCVALSVLCLRKLPVASATCRNTIYALVGVILQQQINTS